MTAEEFNKLREETNAKCASRHHSNPEHELQIACVNWFRLVYPEYHDCFWATPNGGYRSTKTARDMKKEGQLSGVPDLQLAVPSSGYHGLFIEMKRSEVGKKGGIINKGITSERQNKVMAQLRKNGYRVEVCYTFDEFRKMILSYMNH